MLLHFLPRVSGAFTHVRGAVVLGCWKFRELYGLGASHIIFPA